MSNSVKNWQELVTSLNGVEYQDWENARVGGRLARIEFAPGLTDTEVLQVESTFEFRFPADLRAFLQVALPCSPKFPNWRFGDEAELREWLALPLRGILFDVEHNGFWLSEWGKRPTNLQDTIRVTTELVQDAPTLNPVFSHRMMANEPHEPGNPVFSVHQTDIIPYGVDLDYYFRREFLWPEQDCIEGECRPIRFWDLDKFFEQRWNNGPVAFDNRDGILP